jgi:hypothetical protein
LYWTVSLASSTCGKRRKSVVIAIEMWMAAPHHTDFVLRLRLPSAMPPTIAASA